MITLNVLIVLFMAIGLVVFVGEPLVRRASRLPLDGPQEQVAERLSLQKDTLYTAIRDLDFDFQTGKVDQQDYTHLRHQLESEAAEVLRQLDTFDPLAALDDVIERQVAALRNHSSLTSSSSAPSPCPHCQTSLHGRESFCPTCGQPLESA